MAELQSGWLSASRETAVEISEEWQSALADVPPLLELPTARPRPVLRAYWGDALDWQLPECGAVSELCFLAGVGVLLHRYADQDRFCLGVLTGKDGILPVVLDFAEQPTFAAVAEQVRRGLSSRAIPLEELAAAEGAFTPFVQVAVSLGGEAASAEPHADLFDLCFQARWDGNGWGGLLHFNQELFDRDFVERTPGHLGMLLAAATADPERRIGEMCLLTPGEARQLDGWDPAAVVSGDGYCLHQLFEEQAARSPEAPALLLGRERISYGELNQSANRLARRLRREAGAGRPVALLLERSFTGVTALLAALKSGCPYAPLSSTDPPQRIALLLAEIRPGLIVTTRALRDLLPETELPVLCLDQETEALAQEAADNPDFPMDWDDPAYIFFTSGSTGVPKAVLGSHRGTVQRTNWWRETSRPRPDEVMCTRASYSMPPFLQHVFWPLSAGLPVVVLPEGAVEDVQEFVRRLGEHGITRLNMVPSLLRAMLDAHSDLDRRLAALQVVQCGAEPLTLELVRRFREALPGRTLAVAYGSTETSTGFTWFDTAELRPEHLRVPVGRAMPHCRVVVLDRYRQPVPQGVVGEVFVGGPCLTLGYYERPELTAERFIEIETPGGEPQRFYRMGDLARILPDGNLDLLGRRDHQVKVRGFRVELEEIETRLAAVPGVRRAAVALRPFPDGEPRLVAYWTASGEAPVSGTALRRVLEGQLPAAAVPALFQRLEALPILPSGKLDRHALPAPDFSWADRETPVLVPRTPVEERLAALWSSLLGIAQVGVRDRFLDLGGHSLMAARLLSRVREEFGVEVSIRAFLDAPTVEGLAALVEAAPANVPEPGEGPKIRPRQHGKTAPLSFGQQRIWFLEQLEPGSVAYNEPATLAFQGVLDREALSRGLDEIVRRHAALRARYLVENGEPRQEFVEPFHLELPVEERPGLDPAAREAAVQQTLDREVGTPFDLERGPLLRVRLLRFSETEHVLTTVLHHSVMDGWSTNVLLEELARLYSAFREGRPSPLPELPLQYADFAAWQREQALSEPALRYWEGQLRGVPELELPVDSPRPARMDPSGKLVRLELGTETCAGMQELCRTEQVTPFMVLLAGLSVLLSRWTGSDEFAIGAPIADRPFPETEGLIGIFLNSLAFRMDVSGRPTFRELLRRARQTTLDGYAHQEVPFERIVERLQPVRDSRRHPIYDVMLNFLSAPRATAEFAGLEVGRIQHTNTPSKLALTLYARQRGERINLALAYQAAIFSEERMRCLMEELGALLRQAAANPDRGVGEYSLVDAGSRAVLPDPASVLEQPEFPSVVESFLAQVQKHPEAPALAQGEAAWSYARLSAAAARVQERLRDGAAGEVVGISGERGFGLIAGMLGVLAAGKVLLTLDPALPAARRAEMVKEAGCRRVLCVDTAGTAAELPDGVAAETVPLEGAGSGLESTARHGAAYLFFTSGSTGKPKAVLGTHEGLAHFLDWERAEFEMGPGDRCSQLTSLSFDALLRDVFLPLTSGATLCLPDSRDLENGEALFGWMERQGITMTHTVPSLLAYWLGSRKPGPRLRCLRRLVLVGEPLSAELVQRWRREFPEAGKLVNFYGPTETTLIKFRYSVPDPPHPGIQPLGFPLPQTQGLVLSGDGHMCGPYEPGEIVIRTPFRSLGYGNAPEETAARFRPNHFRPGSADDLLYYTGDRGYYRADGSLAILGRLDDQVKIRGVRVAPAEIEAALVRHRDLRAAVVTAHTPEGKEPRLVAYVVPEAGREPAGAELRAFLLEQLPPALVPAVFMPLERLPLTPNGKVNKRALPAPPEGSDLPAAASRAPRDETERRLAGIWQRVLNQDTLGIDDDFFERGGHSLLAVALLTQIEREFGTALPLATLMRTTTIAGMASLLRGEAAPTGTGVLVPIQPEGSRSPFFAVHGIGGGVLCYRAMSNYLGKDQPVYGLQAVELTGESVGYQSVEQMAARYLAAVREVQPVGPYYLGGLSFGGHIAMEMAAQLLKAGERVQFLAFFDSKAPGYPRYHGPLRRAAAHGEQLLRLKPAGQWEYVQRRLVSLGDQIRRRTLGTWYRMNDTLPAALEDVGIAHLQAIRDYVRHPYPGKITLFRAMSQPVGCIVQRDNGWNPYTPGGLEVIDVPGEHITILEEPNVRELAARLAVALEQAVMQEKAGAG